MKSLYNTKDVAEVRDALLKGQDSKCKLTGLAIDKREAVLDHDHSSQFVRAVLHRQSNAVLGKIENLWKRYLAWWYVGTLSDFLRQCADYIDGDHKKDYYHPGWKKKVKTEFNKLNATNQQVVIQELYDILGFDIPVDKKSNGIIRKAQFAKLILNRELGYVIISNVLTNVKGPNET